ncbi:MAG: hypothetical protein ACRDP1_15990 [Nocardioidaceae bacterium]
MDNLGPLCPRHHRLKTHGRWRLAQPFNGIIVWHDPSGAIYTVDHRGIVPAYVGASDGVPDN